MLATISAQAYSAAEAATQATARCVAMARRHHWRSLVVARAIENQAYVVAVNRVGVDGNGGLVWAGGRLSPLDLANALIAAGAVRAMEMDINPDWVNFNSYDVGPDNVAHGNGLYGATGTDRYLSPDGRDFIALFVRGTVVAGATAKLGVAPLAARVKLK